MMNLEPIGWVRGGRTEAEDDFWGGTQVAIELAEGFEEEALQGLEDFSHVEVIFLFHQVDEAKIVTGARHPRNNPAWPAIGIFAQRGRNRPNRMGVSICRLLSVEGTKLRVRGLMRWRARPSSISSR